MYFLEGSVRLHVYLQQFASHHAVMGATALLRTHVAADLGLLDQPVSTVRTSALCMVLSREVAQLSLLHLLLPYQSLTV